MTYKRVGTGLVELKFSYGPNSCPKPARIFGDSAQASISRPIIQPDLNRLASMKFPHLRAVSRVAISTTIMGLADRAFMDKALLMTNGAK